MKVVVYYIELTDAQRDEINSKGWSCDIGRAYLAAKDGRIDDETRDLFCRAATLDAAENEEVWHRLQNGMHNRGAWVEDPDITCHTTFPRSMDVGDLVCWENGRIDRCVSMGFENIAEEGAGMFPA